MMQTLGEAAVMVGQSVELSIVAKATAIVVAGLVAARLASRARASVRHLLLAATFAALVVLPPLLVAGPQATIDVPVAHTRGATAAGAVRPASAAQPGAGDRATLDRQSHRLSGLMVARAVWLTGAAIFLAPIPSVLGRLRRIRRTGLPWPDLRTQAHALALARGIRRPVELMRHELMNVEVLGLASVTSTRWFATRPSMVAGR